jgi:beta-lactamase superfamily II metal-dependent hydrolase
LNKHLVAVTVAIGFVGCSSPSSVTVPEILTVDQTGNAVDFTVSEPTLGTVRYGFSPGDYEAVAYPASAQRRDKFFRTEHRVPLLSATEGDTLYYQILIETEDGRDATSPEAMFVVGSLPVTPSLLTWTMINVGWGDSHVLTMPDTGTRVMIDAGERRDWPNVRRFLDAHGIGRLDYVIATHIHADHIGGMVGENGTSGVLGTYDIGMFLDSPSKSASRFAYQQILDILHSRSIPIDTLWTGDTDATRPVLQWDPAVRVEVLHSGHLSGSNDLNNDSIVIRLSYGEVDLLTGGDAEEPVEAKMVADVGTGLASEVLKVHHHGLDTNSSPASSLPFLNAVNPRVGMIPLAAFEFSDADPYGGVARKLRDLHVDVYASDRAGVLDLVPDGNRGYDVTVATDGRSYELRAVDSASTLYPGATETFAPGEVPATEGSTAP